MTDFDEQQTEHLSAAERVARSVTAKLAAYREKFPATDHNGRPIPAEELAQGSTEDHAV